MARDENGNVLLIRHRYAPGWQLPGGGVERGETLEQALAREFEEEVGVSFTGRPRLFGVYGNFDSFPGDHIAVFVIDEWNQQPRRSLEIAEWGLFSFDSLPDDTTPGTRRRLAEVSSGVIHGTMW